MDFNAVIRQARSLPDAELLRRVHSLTPQAEEHIAAKLELERRERKRRFWRQDLVAWLALVLAVISLIVSAMKR